METLQHWIHETLKWGKLERFSNLSIFGAPLLLWLVGAVVAFIVFSALQFLKAFLKRRAKYFTRFSPVPGFEDLVAKLLGSTRNFVLGLLSITVACYLVVLPVEFLRLTRTITILSLLYQVIIWGNILIKFWLDDYASRKVEEDPGVATTVRFGSILAKLVFYAVVFLLALDNLGVDITTLVAGLGVGGIAVGLALQNILGDLFASLSIVLDKPFVIGDFIVVGKESGNIERIGLKTTRVKSLGGEQLVFSNSDLLQSRIQNYQRMVERRIAFKFGVLYETPYEKLSEIPAMVKAIIEGVKTARFDRAHFLAYGESSLDFEVVYYVLAPDFLSYANTQQEINLGLFKTLGDADIGFAYPTRTLYLANKVAIEGSST